MQAILTGGLIRDKDLKDGFSNIPVPRHYRISTKVFFNFECSCSYFHVCISFVHDCTLKHYHFVFLYKTARAIDEACL